MKRSCSNYLITMPTIFIKALVEQRKTLHFMDIKSILRGEIIGQGAKPEIAIEILTRNGIRTPALDVHFPHGVIGDKLLVREAWSCRQYNTKGDVEITYVTDGEKAVFRKKDFGDNWVMPKTIKSSMSPISMPAWATRFVLDISSIEVKRLSEINDTEADAIGVESFYSESDGKWHYKNYLRSNKEEEITIEAKPLSASESLNGYYLASKSAKNRNFNSCPQLWLIGFTPIRLPAGTFNTVLTSPAQMISSLLDVNAKKLNRTNQSQPENLACIS